MQQKECRWLHILLFVISTSLSKVYIFFDRITSWGNFWELAILVVAIEFRNVYSQNKDIHFVFGLPTVKMQINSKTKTFSSLIAIRGGTHGAFARQMTPFHPDESVLLCCILFGKVVQHGPYIRVACVVPSSILAHCYKWGTCRENVRQKQ